MMKKEIIQHNLFRSNEIRLAVQEYLLLGAIRNERRLLWQIDHMIISNAWKYSELKDRQMMDPKHQFQVLFCFKRVQMVGHSQMQMDGH